MHDRSNSREVNILTLEDVEAAARAYLGNVVQQVRISSEDSDEISIVLRETQTVDLAALWVFLRRGLGAEELASKVTIGSYWTARETSGVLINIAK